MNLDKLKDFIDLGLGARTVAAMLPKIVRWNSDTEQPAAEPEPNFGSAP